MKRLARIAALAILAGALPLAAASPVLAHAELVKANPAPDSAGAAPASLEISFSEPIEITFTQVAVKDAAGQPVATGLAVIDPGDNKTIHVPLSAAPAAGAVTVDWTVVSSDGHKTNGTYSFTVK